MPSPLTTRCTSDGLNDPIANNDNNDDNDDDDDDDDTNRLCDTNSDVNDYSL